MSKIHFTKMHGCGNDYIYVDTMQYPIADPVQASILLSDRHKGIGSDGLVLIDRSSIPEADYTMRIFNADGSEAMMCGNASRCIGKYLYERGLTTQTKIRLLTNSGIKTLNLHVKAASKREQNDARINSVESRWKKTEGQLKPLTKREQTLDSLAFTLNHIWLQDHGAKTIPYPKLDEEDIQMPLAAEARV